MTIDELRVALETYLSPLLSAEVRHGTVPCSANSKLVASLEPCSIAIKAQDGDEERIVLYRKPGFTPEELVLTKDFIEELVAIHDATTPAYRAEIFTFLPSRAIARHLGGLGAVTSILRQFDLWSARTYEGGAISSSIGVDPASVGKDTDLDEIFAHDFSAVISNGFDTLIVVNSDGQISGAGQLNGNQLGLDFAPYRLNAIADWSAGNKIALVLNRLGEQLVFRNRKLVFAKRRGAWQYYAHEMYIRQLQPPQDRELREAIYQSCLDISFSRTGGCILVIRSGGIDEASKLVSSADFLYGDAPSVKAKAIRAMVSDKFQDLDRRLRQEILALDGATVLDHKGNIIAAGAIISVPAGSEGGGRTAAAKKGSTLGLGIKISEDGGITVFKDSNRVFGA